MLRSRATATKKSLQRVEHNERVLMSIAVIVRPMLEMDDEDHREAARDRNAAVSTIVRTIKHSIDDSDVFGWHDGYLSSNVETSQ